jgi:Glycosyl hydrolases family 16
MPIPITIPTPIAGLNYSLAFSDDFTNWAGGNGTPWYTNPRGTPTGSNPGTGFGGGPPGGSCTYSQSNISQSGSILTISAINSSGAGSVPGTWTDEAIGLTSWGTSGPNIGTQFTYGFFEVYVHLPATVGGTGVSGIHPGFWLYPGSSASTSDYEIDVFEFYGNNPADVNSTLWNWNISQQSYVQNYNGNGLGFPYPSDWTQAYHAFQVLWTSSNVNFYIDNYGPTHVVTPTTSPTNGLPTTGLCLDISFDIENSASNPVTSSTGSPLLLAVDWIRVWQINASAPTSFTLAGTGSGTTGVQTPMIVFFNGTTSGSTILTLNSSNGGSFQATSGGANLPSNQLTVPSSSTQANFYFRPSAASTSTISATASGLTQIGSPVTYVASGSAPSSHAIAAILLTV